MQNEDERDQMIGHLYRGGGCSLRVWFGAVSSSQEGTSGKTPLHLAVELRDSTSVKLLLSRGADVDAAMFNGCTPLHLAVGRRDATIANILCQSGADMMLRNVEDETALDLADGNDDVSEEVLSKGENTSTLLWHLRAFGVFLEHYITFAF